MFECDLVVVNGSKFIISASFFMLSIVVVKVFFKHAIQINKIIHKNFDVDIRLCYWDS